MKNISIFANKDKVAGSPQPDFRMVASWRENGEWKNVTVASLWRCDSENPNGPKLTGKMSEEYTNGEGKTFPAFEIKRAGTAPQEVNVPTAPKAEDNEQLTANGNTHLVASMDAQVYPVAQQVPAGEQPPAQAPTQAGTNPQDSQDAPAITEEDLPF